MTLKTRAFIPCYIGFFATGYNVLLLGAIIPYLIAEYGISYTMAGTFVSSFALGNLAASFFSPFAVSKLGLKTAIVTLVFLIPTGFSSVLWTINPLIIAILLFVAGVGRGSVSNMNNYIVNEFANGQSNAMNVLHVFFACGAFFAPLLTSFFVSNGFSWNFAVIFGIFLCICAVFGYIKLPLKNEKSIIQKQNAATTNDFLRKIDFYIVCALLFTYIGFEYSVNGWFITYFKKSGIMSVSYAANLVSILWVLIIFGRLATAATAKKFSKRLQIIINIFGCTLFLFPILFSSNLTLITISIIGMGFFMAGIYPTCVANIGLIIKGNQIAMAVLMAVAGIGGIIVPQIIGFLADKIGIMGAMSFLLFDTSLLVLFAIINFFRKNG